jgi:hypothetical protein
MSGSRSSRLPMMLLAVAVFIVAAAKLVYDLSRFTKP